MKKHFVFVIMFVLLAMTAQAAFTNKQLLNKTVDFPTLSNFTTVFNFDTNTNILAGRMQADCDDMQPKDFNESVDYAYFIEPNTCDTTTTKLWATITGNPSNKIYNYFNDPAVTSVSNNTNVFDSGHYRAVWLCSGANSTGGLIDHGTFGNGGNPQSSYANTTGIHGYACNFAGTATSAFTVPPSASLNVTLSQSATWIFWMKSSACAGDFEVIFDKRPSDNVGFVIAIDTFGSPFVKIGDQSSTTTVLNPTTNDMCDGAWHQYVVVRDTAADTLSVYLDGTYIDSATDDTTSTLGSGANMFIGESYANSLYYNGALDSMRFMNVALNASYIKDIYQIENQTLWTYGSILNVSGGGGGIVVNATNFTYVNETFTTLDCPSHGETKDVLMFLGVGFLILMIIIVNAYAFGNIPVINIVAGLCVVMFGFTLAGCSQTIGYLFILIGALIVFMSGLMVWLR